LSLDKSGILKLERTKIGEEPLTDFTFFCYVSDFKLTLIKPLCFEEIDRECLNNVETRWARGRKGLLASYCLEAWWEMRPLGLYFYMGISESVSTTL
jgi:hypothetical protein